MIMLMDHGYSYHNQMLFFQKSMDFPVVFLLAIFLSHHGRINWSNSPRIIIRKNHVKHSAQAISFFAFKFIASDNHLIYIYIMYIYIDIQIPMKDGDFLVYLWKMVIPSGYVKIAIENGHRNSEFSQLQNGDFP